jgi:hypothetical protein
MNFDRLLAIVIGSIVASAGAWVVSGVLREIWLMWTR